LSHPTLDGNGVKAMPGRFKYPMLVYPIQYLKRKKIQVAKWGTPKNIFKKNSKNYVQALLAIIHQIYTDCNFYKDTNLFKSFQKYVFATKISLILLQPVLVGLSSVSISS